MEIPDWAKEETKEKKTDAVSNEGARNIWD